MRLVRQFEYEVVLDFELESNQLELGLHLDVDTPLALQHLLAFPFILHDSLFDF
jgi:hypothetical protein